MKNRRRKTVFSLLIVSVLVLALPGCSAGKAELAQNDEIYWVSNVSSKAVGETARKLPETKNGGLARYPEYGKGLAGATAEEKQAILDENNAMFDYDAMDADGNLYKGGQSKGEKLFKHTAADGLYNGSIPDSAPAVARRVRINPMTIGNNMTGLYAPPGEVVTVILEQKDAGRNMMLEIGQGSQRQGGNVIPVGKNYTRMPRLKKQLYLNNVVNYVGSPLGGPIYIFNENNSNKQPYEVTIIGAVEYPNFILGSTTDADWERTVKSPGTIFDLETVGGVRLTMPASFVRGKSAAEMRRVAEFWDKCAQLANKVSNGNWFASHPVTMVYDNYIPAGAAVAIVGADVCYLPTDWGGNAVNYEQIMTSGGWGNFHEMNHHHQGWGAGNGGEVTNNVINSMIYMLHTNVGASRTESGGLSGWNWVTSASSALTNVLGSVGKGANTSLGMYVTLLHAFGQDAMIEMAQRSRAQTQTAWYRAASEVTGYDMTYYLKEICGFTDIEQGVTEEIQSKGWPVFVPVANLYQTGRDYLLPGDGPREMAFAEMGKPFYIPFGKEKVLDLTGHMVVPEGISWEIAKLSAPKFGKIREWKDESGQPVPGKYVYTPSKKSREADTFTLRLKLTNEQDPSVKIEDVTLRLALIQDVGGVSATVWENPGYSDIETAVGDNFESRLNHGTETDFGYAGLSVNRTGVMAKAEGKLVVPQDGTYRIFVKGNSEVRLDTGASPDKLTRSAFLSNMLKQYDDAREGSWFNVSLKAGEPLYFRIYAMAASGNLTARMGWADVTQQEGAAPEVTGDTGVAVPGEGTGSGSDIPIVDIPAAYVYHTDADTGTPLRSEYESERLYVRQYTASGSLALDQSKMRVSSGPAQYGGHKLEYMLDGDMNTYCHTTVGGITKAPEVFAIDLGSSQRFNQVSLTFRDSGRGRIKDYELYAGDSPLEYSLLSEGVSLNQQSVTLTFPEVKARYVKLVAKSAYPGNGQYYVAIADFQVSRGITSAALAPHNGSDVVYQGSWSENTFGTFLNGAVYETEKGRMEVSFHGTAFGLFAKTGRDYGRAEIRIDGGDWESVDFYGDTDRYGQLVCVYTDLADGYHKVELRAKGQRVNVDYMAFKPTAEPPAKTLGAWWVAIGIAIALGCIALGTAAYFITKKLSEKGVFRRFQTGRGNGENGAEEIAAAAVGRKNAAQRPETNNAALAGAEQSPQEGEGKRSPVRRKTARPGGKDGEQ